jgi:hypothetical protein
MNEIPQLLRKADKRERRWRGEKKGAREERSLIYGYPCTPENLLVVSTNAIHVLYNS